jgi:hypothetical protein
LWGRHKAEQSSGEGKVKGKLERIEETAKSAIVYKFEQIILLIIPSSLPVWLKINTFRDEDEVSCCTSTSICM